MTSSNTSANDAYTFRAVAAIIAAIVAHVWR
jgi:Na+-transporting methylmalonyl-CoA/oxaloacetate decarboxylase gamma subunit